MTAFDYNLASTEDFTMTSSVLDQIAKISQSIPDKPTKRVCIVDDCYNTATPRYRECNPCRTKRVQAGKINVCSGCRIVMTQDNSDPKYRTCNSCRERSKKITAHRKNQKKCQAMGKNGEQCSNPATMNGGLNFCKKHLSLAIEDNKVKVGLSLGVDKSNLTKEIENLIKFTNQLNYSSSVSTGKNLLYRQTLFGLENEKQNLIRLINKLSDFSPERVRAIRKLYEVNTFKSEFPVAYYREKVYNPFSNFYQEQLSENWIDQLELELEIIPRVADCKTVLEKQLCKKAYDCWEFFRINVSSISTKRNPGKHIRLFIREKHSKKYLGIMAIGSDVLHIRPLDKAVGWTYKQKIKEGMSKYLVNIVCCVGIRPCSYNLNIGKLMAMAAFSKELQEEFYRRYSHYYACVDTFSIYGKSIQYAKLKCLKFLPEMTLGRGCNIPDQIYDSGMKYLKNLGYDLKQYNTMASGKLRKTQLLFRELGLEMELMYHNQQRGIYYGYTCPEAQDFLCQRRDDFTPEMKPFDQIVSEWKELYAKRRLKHLTKETRVLTEIELLCGLPKEEQLRYRLRDYHTRLEERMGTVNYRSMLNLSWKEWFYKQKYNEIYLFDKSKYLHCKIDLDPYYLGGLFDGDGCLSIHRLKGSRGYQLWISLTQSQPNILEVLQLNFGGAIYIGRHNPGQRCQYYWRIVGGSCRELLKALSKGCIIKFEQTKACARFLELINKPDSHEKYELWSKINALNYKKNRTVAAQQIYDQAERPHHRLCVEYIAGLFDAEGNLYISRKQKTKIPSSYRVKISQSGYPRILKEIRGFLGVGKADKMAWILSNTQCIPILTQLSRFVIVKKIQVEAFICYVKLIQSKDYSPEAIEKRNILKEIIDNDKHENHALDKDLLDLKNQMFKIDKGKEDLFTKIIMNEVSRRVQVNRQPINQGSNNANYGKNLKESHSQNIAISKRLRMDLADDVKDEIYQLYDQGLTYVKIGKLTGIDRNRISQVIKDRGKSIEQICKEAKAAKEAKTALKQVANADEYNKLLNRQNAARKLKVPPEIIVEIVSMKPSGKSQVEVVKIFKDRGYNVSRDMVSNYWRGKSLKSLTPEMFEDQELSWQQFWDIINGNKSDQYTPTKKLTPKPKLVKVI